MIYLSIETQLAMIREDLDTMKQYLGINGDKTIHIVCPDCAYAEASGAGKCVYHAPEFLMRVNIPLD